MKKTKLNFYSEIIGACSNLLLNLTFIPLFGIIGAAVGTSISITLRNVSSYLFVYKNLKFHPYNLKFVKIFFATFIAISSIYLLFSSFKTNLIVIIAFPVYISIYLILFYYLNGFEKMDMILIKKMSIKLKNLIFK